MSDDRTDYLRSLSEEQLRSVVLIPLLTQMGFADVIEYHGSVEKGKWKGQVCFWLLAMAVLSGIAVNSSSSPECKRGG